jgi:hypothetical protein
MSRQPKRASTNTKEPIVGFISLSSLSQLSQPHYF